MSKDTTKLLAQKRPIILSGPSGAGKSTLIARLTQNIPNTFGFSISHTTRQPRGQEQHGREYHFVPVEHFKDMISKDGFVEHAQYGSNHYGTSKSEIARIRSDGKVPILDIEMEGVKQIHKDAELGPLTRYCSVQAPSLGVLEQRLRGRGTDSEESVQKRLKQAENEVAYSKEEGSFDKILVNDDLDRAYADLEAWILEG